MLNTKILILLLFVGLGLCGCPSSDSTVEPPAENYDGLIQSGWSEFSNKNYSDAITKFDKAKSLKPDNYDAYNGLGWAYFKDDQLSKSINEFSNGSQKSGSTSDIEAGWSFVLNAEKMYNDSNSKIAIALTNDPNWTFSNGLELNRNHLIILKAENFYLIGSFEESLIAVQELNPSFLVNVLTNDGKALLALEIERLKGEN